MALGRSSLLFTPHGIRRNEMELSSSSLGAELLPCRRRRRPQLDLTQFSLGACAVINLFIVNLRRQQVLFHVNCAKSRLWEN